MEKGIGIIGIDKEFKNRGVDVIIIDEPITHINDSFDLNGVKYIPIKKEQIKHKYATSKLNGIMAAASAIYNPYMNDLYDYGLNKYNRKLPILTNIIKEYGLIQNKQSKLCKWERDEVVWIFEKNYCRLDNNQSK